MSSYDSATQYTTHQPSINPPVPPELPKSSSIVPFSNRKSFKLNECKWASAYPEIQKACYLARICSTVSPKSCRLKCIQPVLQEGPTCGLTALSMLMNGHPPPDELLRLARRQNYTRNGEMFSADQLFALTQTVIEMNQNENANIVAHLYKGKIFGDSIKQVLLMGGCLLVPYPF